MKIVLIGAGNVATSLGKALLDAGNDILQVYSRTQESAARLAEMLGGSPVTDLDKVNPEADVYIVSVKDSVIANERFNGFDPELGNSVYPKNYSIGINVGF